jgi:hypothetical protein
VEVTAGRQLQQIVMGAQEGEQLLVHVGLVLVLEGMAEQQAVDMMEVVGVEGQALTEQPGIQDLQLLAIRGRMELTTQIILAEAVDQQLSIVAAHPRQEVMGITGVLGAEAVEVTLEQAPREQGERELMVTFGLRLAQLEQELEEADQEPAAMPILRAQVEQEGYMGAEEDLVDKQEQALEAQGLRELLF